MSGPPLTVPPPHDDDHEDVAWALRAASAQWKRHAHADAIHWVQRAAQTAEDVGDGPRFTELCLLVAALERAVSSGSLPPPPPPPPGNLSSGPPTISVQEVDVDIDFDDDDGVEMLDDDADIEMLDEVEDIEELDDVEDLDDVDEIVELDESDELDSGAPTDKGRHTSARPRSASSQTGQRPSREPHSASSSFPPESTGPSRVGSSRPSSARASSRSPSSWNAGARGTGSWTGTRSSSRPSSRGSSFPSARSSSWPSKSTGPASSRFPAAGATASRGSSAPGSRRSTTTSSDARSQTDSKRSTTTSRKLDRLPPSMRPEPSGLDLAEEPEDPDFPESQRQAPHHFDDEVPTNRVQAPSVPPDVGPVSFEGPSEIPFARETAAEYAQARHEADHDHEELEKEFGIDLSIPTGKIAREQVSAEARSAQENSVEAEGRAHQEQRPPSWEDQEEGSGDSFSDFAEQPPASRPNVSSVPPPRDVSEDSPVPGRASVLPSIPAQGSQRITSAESEPYALAPSASLPPTASVEPAGQRERSWSSQAPPPDLVTGSDERPSELPSVGVRESPPSVEAPRSEPMPSAPDLDEFEDMFDKLSLPPKKRETEIPELEQPTTRVDEPPDLVLPGTSSGDEIRVDGLDFLELEGFRDLPPDAARALARTAQLKNLRPNEEVSGFGVALVTRGAVQLMPTIADATCHIVRRGEVLFTKGTLERSAAVRVVGMEEGSKVAIFSAAALEAATSSCPWVADELAEIANKYLAFAGAVLGDLGGALDEMFRFMVLEKCTVRFKPEGALIAHGGEAMDGMYVLGAGALEVLNQQGQVQEQLAMGDFVFPDTVLSASPAQSTVRVGKGGALLLYADRMSAHELLATCPPLIEILAG